MKAKVSIYSLGSPRLSQLQKPVFFDYLTYLQSHGLADSTVGQHIKFLRICH
jgi:hypothetical protein